MESYNVTVRGKCRGMLLRNRTVVPWNGPMLTITSEADYPKKYKCTGFHRAALDRTGNVIAAGDFQGNIYIFDTKQNRYWFVCHIDKSCSCIAFTSWKEKDLIVASSDCSVVFMDSETGNVKNVFNVHQTCVNHISLNKTETKAITSSLDVAIIWQMQDLKILHKLKLKKNIDILKVFFLGVDDYLVSAFRDCSVFLWNSDTLSVKDQFICEHKDPYWLKTVDGSKNGLLIACGGKSDEIMVWSHQVRAFLYTISLSKHLTSIKQLMFLQTPAVPADCHLISALSHEGKMHFYDIDATEYWCKLNEDCGKIESFTEEASKMVIITSSSGIKLYDLEVILKEENKPVAKADKFKGLFAAAQSSQIPKKVVKPKRIQKMAKKDPYNLGRKQLKSILSTYGQYPSRYRTIIWSEILKLPRNQEYVLFCKELNVEYPIELPAASPSIKRAFLKMNTMICEWCSPMAQIDYIPTLIFPFVKVMPRNIPVCFELLLTYLMNWCQNWFQFIPFMPYNIIAVIENLLLYHDRILLHYFLQHNIPPEVYAFQMLKTSFSEVFSEGEWLQLWDNIFSNPPDFLIFIVVAYNIYSRDFLMSCTGESEVKVFLSHQFTLVEGVLNLALELRSRTPACFDPSDIVGTFAPLPKGGYPVFNRFALMVTDLQTLDRQRIIDDDMETLQRRQEELEFSPLGDRYSTSMERRAILERRLSELEQIQELMRYYVMQSVPKQHVHKLEEAEDKVNRIQGILQKNLVAQVENFEYEVQTRELVFRRSHVKKVPAAAAVENIVFDHVSTGTPLRNLDCRQTVMDILDIRESMARK